MKGGRFNWKGLEALYLSLDVMTALREASGGFSHRMNPLTMVSYDVDCDQIVDLRDDAARAVSSAPLPALACAWLDDLLGGREPASWGIVRRLLDEGTSGIVVPSFASGAQPDDYNLVLWRWGPDLPHRVSAYDPSGRLPQNQLSWL